MSSRSVVNFSEGMSFNYLMKGTMVAVFSGVLSVFFLPALIGVLIGLGLILATSGVEIDTEKKQYRNYIGFVIAKMGVWKDLGDTINIELAESVQQYRKRSFIMTLFPGGGALVVHKTYDVSVENYMGTKLIINDFDAYEQAVECMKVLERVTNKTAVNHYAIETAKIIERRKQGRRR